MSKANKRTYLTNEQKVQLWRSQIGLDEESVCPGCLIIKIFRKRPTTWQVCHVEACSRGGTIQLYNLFIMCKPCNDAQGTQNLYVFLHRTGNAKGLWSLMAYAQRVFEHQYSDLWTSCNELLHAVAERMLIDKDVEATGKIHPRDPVLRFFVAFDKERARERIQTLESALDHEKERLKECEHKEARLRGLPRLSGRAIRTPQQFLSLGL